MKEYKVILGEEELDIVEAIVDNLEGCFALGIEDAIIKGILEQIQNQKEV
tara:strand:+ start:111 stop:260 length:150 start_codon:yes stop_codon:yes gene_type:complete